MASKYPEFSAPESYLIPEGIAEGETFEDIAQFKLKSNGKICLVKIGDAPILDDGKEEPDDYGTEEGMGNRISEAYKNRA